MRFRRILLGLLAVLGALEIAYVGAGLYLVGGSRASWTAAGAWSTCSSCPPGGTEKGAFGKVLASYGAPSVGIELRGQERELHVLRPEHWFESR